MGLKFRRRILDVDGDEISVILDFVVAFVVMTFSGKACCGSHPSLFSVVFMC